MKNPLLTAACLVALTAAPVLSQDDPEAGLDEAVKLIAAVNDPIFNQYVNFAALDQAWTNLDAAALAEIGINLAKAERILFRQHPAVSAEEVLKIAVRTASVDGDTKALEKLEEYAKEADNGEMVGQIKMAKQLAGTSRSVAPSVSLDDVGIESLIAYKQAQHELKAALVTDDIDLLKELQEQVNDNTEKEPAIWSKLNAEVNQQVKSMATLGAASRGGPNDLSGAGNALNKLSGASRMGGMGMGTMRASSSSSMMQTGMGGSSMMRRSSSSSMMRTGGMGMGTGGMGMRPGMGMGTGGMGMGTGGMGMSPGMGMGTGGLGTGGMGMRPGMGMGTGGMGTGGMGMRPGMGMGTGGMGTGGMGGGGRPILSGVLQGLATGMAQKAAQTRSGPLF